MQSRGEISAQRFFGDCLMDGRRRYRIVIGSRSPHPAFDTRSINESIPLTREHGKCELNLMARDERNRIARDAPIYPARS
jgi:hypothetical protein